MENDRKKRPASGLKRKLCQKPHQARDKARDQLVIGVTIASDWLLNNGASFS